MNRAKLRLGVLVAGVGCATLGGCLVTFERYVYDDDAGSSLPDSSTTGGSGGTAGASTGGAFGGGGSGGASAGAAGNGGAAGAGGAPAPLDSPCVAHPGSSAHVRSIATGNAHTCVVRCDDTAACWGSNSNGQLGGATEFGPGVTAGPTTVSDASTTLAGVQEIAAGVDFSCARTADNVYCWGRNNTAQLGFSGTDRATATAFSPPLVASALAVGRAHACAITADHRVQCWGSNVASELGRGSTAVSGPPADVLVSAAGAPLSDVTAIAASGDHTCAWNSVSNQVLCWGRNQSRESGGCCATQYDFPTALPAPDSGAVAGVTALTAGPFYSCALAGPEHTLWCWGDDASNQWGGAHGPSSTPVSLLAGPSTVSAGGSFTVATSAHACGVFANRAYCWGSPDSGRLGNGDTSGTPTDTKVRVTLSQGAVSVAAGADHACAVLADGKVACWGKNTSWQVTGRAGTAVTVPVPVTLTSP